ncbi:shufflon system plasmid conjugative transfer pilus tip adhesin PilV [Orrella sp. JC864]|uniref:shufflon system plasmid conjugative transfer pilus tip adhesin PilV n=1 Tax=Orrella sp. JC864 TaxID=3120298 RepID=UPI003009ACBF
MTIFSNSPSAKAKRPGPRARPRAGRSGARRAPRGFALIELTLAAALLSLAAIWAAGAWERRIEDAGAQALARWLLAIEAAARPALAQMEQHARGQAAGPLPTALSGGVTVAGLKQLGYLDAGFPERSAWNDGASIQVLQGQSCPGPACAMDLLIHTGVGSGAADPGRRADRVGAVLLAAQGKAGAVHAHDPGRVRGAVFNLPNPPSAQAAPLAPGSIAVLVAGSAPYDDPYVRRRDTRDPALQGALSVAGQANFGAGALLQGDLQVRGGAALGGWASVQGGLTAGGTLTGQGRVVAHEFLQVGGIAAAGTGCSPAGLIARDAAGGLLGCSGGVWAAQDGGFGGSYVVNNVRGCIHPDLVNPRTGGCSCPAGYQAQWISQWAPGPYDDGVFLRTYICLR